MGAVLAGLCALVAAVAIIRGAGGLAGGAVGVWIPAAVLSLVASFANQWTPLFVSVALLVGLLVIGVVVRGIVNAGEPSRAAARERKAAAIAAAPPVTTPAPAATSSPATGSIPALAR
ncbi:hypothetical protein [Microbacterium maritypicum]